MTLSTEDRTMLRLKVSLNGTDKNPFHVMGLKQNPFPQLGKAEYAAAEVQLNRLGAEPIKSTQQIRTTLEGFSDVELCCASFVPGKMVEFEVEFAG